MNRCNERSQWFPAAAGFIAAALAALLPACGTPPSELIDDRYRGQSMEGDSSTGNAAVFSKHAVAADHPEASQAGAEMLARGGNAVDAAVATSFALSVVRPESCGIGGGGFMLIHLAKEKRTVVIDYRERAPVNASLDMFEHLPDGASKWSGRSVAVPTTVKGLLHAHERYGTLHRRTVLAPAIRLARLGAVYDRHAARSASELAAFLEQNPGRPADETAAMRSLLSLTDPPRPIDETSKKPTTAQELDELLRRRSLTPMETAPRLRNPAQADVLERIAAEGADGFYQGDVAEAIVAAVNRYGGGLTLADLARVTVHETSPLVGQWGGYTIHTMPLPSSGGVTLLQTLALMDRTKAQWQTGLNEFKGWWAAEAARQPGDDLIIPDMQAIAPYAHAITESFKHAFADRAQYLGDPAFMPADPTPRLLEPARLDAKARRIDPARTLDDDAYANTEVLADLLSHAGSPPEDHGTSHFSVVDQWGNAVACTETINLSYGSRILVKEFGFFLNNQMDDFQTRRGQANAFGLVQSDRNLPQPGKVPLSSMTPTIVLDEHGRVHTVVGASGGPRIITGVAQSLLFARDFGLGASAVNLPRIHHQWKPSQLRVEPFGLPYAHGMNGSFGPAAFVNPDAIMKAGDGALAAEGDKLTPQFVAAMQARGHDIKPMFEGAAVQMIQRNPGGGWHAASDPRKGGAPAGE